MFILKKNPKQNDNSEEFKSEEQGFITDFKPVFNIATTKKSTSVVFSIAFIARIVIINNNGEKEKHNYNKENCFDLKRRIFLNDKNVKAYFYPYREGLYLKDKKIEGFFIEHQL